MCLPFRHKWKIISENAVDDVRGDRIGYKYHLQCEKCGKIKFKSSVPWFY